MRRRSASNDSAKHSHRRSFSSSDLQQPCPPSPEPPLTPSRAKRVQEKAKQLFRAGVSKGKDLLVSVPNKWASFRERTGSTIVMIAIFVLVIYNGPVPMIGLVLFSQILMYKEIIGLAHKVAQEEKLPGMRLLSWWFFAVTILFLYGLFLKPHLQTFWFLEHFCRYHLFISFACYCFGLVAFVLRLRSQKYYKYQFKQFAWSHITCLCVIAQSSLIIPNMLSGLYWAVFPACLVVVNDIMAYLVGMNIGRHPLIKLSPKKTWEGFIGGMVCTIVFAFYFSKFLSGFEFMTCPHKDFFNYSYKCDLDNIYVGVAYPNAPEFLQYLLPADGISPVMWHSLAYGLFASLIAPFGGFFASGFKRALRIKDFGESIPGHGGVTDRMDCQIVMCLFSYVYVHNFLSKHHLDLQVLFGLFSSLSTEEQQDFYLKIHSSLFGQGKLPSIPA